MELNNILDTDSNLLEVRESLIPGAGLGVFTKVDWEQGDIICEYRGPLVEHASQEEQEYAYKLGNLFIIGNTITAYINDRIKWREFTKDEIEGFEKGNPIPFNTDINCTSLGLYKRIWVTAARDIKAGEELYYNYGPNYWIYRMKLDYNARHAND